MDFFVFAFSDAVSVPEVLQLVLTALPSASDTQHWIAANPAAGRQGEEETADGGLAWRRPDLLDPAGGVSSV
jgi:hypothetical protein